MNAQYILLWKRQVAVQLIVPIPIKIEKIVIKHLFFSIEIIIYNNITGKKLIFKKPTLSRSLNKDI